MDQLMPVFRGDIHTQADELKRYSRDASIFEVTPAAVVAPTSVEDVKRLVEFASRRTLDGTHTSLTARSGGTCMSGGPLTEGIVVDMPRHLNGVGTIDTTARRVTVQGGAWHKDLEDAATAAGLLFAPYTSSHDICGIGGMIGNNASGEKSIKYGPTSDNVASLKVVLSDGNEYEFGPLSRQEVEAKKQLPTFEGKLYREITQLLDTYAQTIADNHPRTVKNAAGYALWELWDRHQQTFNMARLFVGAQGTLGITTEAELKLVKLPKVSRMIVTPITDLKTLPDVVRTAMSFEPAACETFDHYTYDLAKKYHPDHAHRAHVADGKHMVILSVYEGDDQHATDVTAGRAKETLEGKGYETFWIDDPATIDSFLTIRRKSFKMLLENPTGTNRAMAFLEDTIVPLERYDEFLVRLEEILHDYHMTYTYAGHIGAGSIRLVPLVDMEQPGAAERIMELETRVNDLVLEFGGSISVDHNDGIIRTPYLDKQFGPEMTALFAQVKQLFDPLNIFNPGKKVSGSYDYALAHIIRENTRA